MSVELVVDNDLSPYIPGTDVQYAWDATSIEHLKRCGRLHHYKTEGWRAKTENIHLRFGTEYHRALQDYEILKAEGFDHRDSMTDVVRSLLFRIQDWNPDDKKKNRETLVRSVIWYLEKFKDDHAKTVIMANGKPAVEVRFSFELDFGPTPDQPYVLCGILDRVVEFNGDLFVMDRKTTSMGLGPYYWRTFTPHNQMTLYTLAGKIIFKAPIKGVIIDAASILIGGTVFERGIVYRTQDQLDEWLADLAVHLSRQNDNVTNDTACDKYGGCEFRDICGKAPSVRNKFLEATFKMEEPWNPLNPRLD